MILSLIKIILGLLGLTIVVSVHELGHLLAARLFKIDILTFSVGIGKKILVLKGEKTEWARSLLPLGGYCRLKGEQNFIQAWEEKSDHIPYEEGSLFSAPWWQRVIVSLAGPAANIIFGAIILSLMIFIRYPENYVDPYIVPVSQYNESGQIWPADEAGLLAGDRIISIGKHEITRYNQIQENVILRGGKELIFTIERKGEIFQIPLTPGLNKENGTGYVGVYPWISPLITGVDDASVLSFLEKGDLITALNGEVVRCTMDFIEIMDNSAQKIETITLDRQGLEVKLSPHITLGEDDPYPQFSYYTELSPSYGPLKSIIQGTLAMNNMVVRTVQSTALLFKGIDLSSALSGPLRISWITGEMAINSFSLGFRSGLYQITQFLALICSALAFMNLLPIPILDGGQVILHIIDGIKRRALTPSFIYYYQLAGTVLVIFLALYATRNDLLFFLRS